MNIDIKRILCLAMLITVFDASAQGFDVVTMNNGDVHNGLIEIKAIRFSTAFADILIPYHDMAQLDLSNNAGEDKLITQLVEVYLGDVQGSKIKFLRTLDPVLFVAFNDISHVHFSNKSRRQKKLTMMGVVTTRHGDIFYVSLPTNTIEIIEAKQKHSVRTKDIRAIDVNWIMDENETLVQIRTMDSQVFGGKLNIKVMLVKSMYGQTINIKPEDISSVTLFSNHQKIQLTDKINWHSEKYFRDQFNDGSFGPEMIKLKAGSFMRGDNAGDDDEKPASLVNLKAFAISAHEITFREYDRYCEQTKCNRPDDQEWGRATRPVVNVSWEDAVAYTQWLSQQLANTYRLASDAEWEYAARAGSLTRFWWGNDVGRALANCEGCESIWSGDKTAPVGRFPPNAFGLYDTAGNVFEWVADCYHNTFEHAPADGSAIDKPGCGKRVIRGGSWSFPAKEIRSANRWRDFPTRRSDDTGFRVVRELME